MDRKWKKRGCGWYGEFKKIHEKGLGMKRGVEGGRGEGTVKSRDGERQ